MTGDSRRLNGIASEQLHVRLGRVDSPESDMKASSFIRMHASCAALWPIPPPPFFLILKIYFFFFLMATRLFKISTRNGIAIEKEILKCVTIASCNIYMLSIIVRGGGGGRSHAVPVLSPCQRRLLTIHTCLGLCNRAHLLSISPSPRPPTTPLWTPAPAGASPALPF